MTSQSPSFRRSKSILKRPAPLSSPFDVHADAFPFATCVTIQFSPALYSPHVHFPSTPTLVSTQPTHSAAIYDRAPILVSPNLLEIPEWGTRIYSPSLGTFRISKLSSPDVPSDPPFSSSEESDSPKSSKDADVQNSVRTSTSSPTVDEIRSFLPYPRSPLPRTLSSPLKDAENSGPVQKTKKSTSRNAHARRGKPRSYKNGTRRKLKGLDLLHVPVANHFGQKAPSTILQQLDSILSPVQESVSPPSNSDSSSSGSGGRPSSRLRRAFWQSVSIQEHVDATSSLEYPDTLLSPVPHFTFGRCDGVLWSPGLPRKSREETDTEHQSSVSPSGDTFSSVDNPQSTPKIDVTSPSPNDPLSNMPSFSTVLESSGLIQYPPPVYLPGGDAA